MRKSISFIGIFLVVISLLVGCSTVDKKKEKSDDIEISEKQIKLAEQYIADFDTLNFDGLKNNYQYNEKMKETMQSSSMETQLTTLKNDLGNVVETKQPYSIVKDKSIIICVPIVFEHQSLNLQLSLSSKNEIEGFFFTKFSEKKEVPSGIKEKELSLKIKEGKSLPGILCVPEKGNNLPVVILVAGSGPNDKDETIGSNKVFQQMAWELSKQGIATYRYDKRTYVYGKDFKDSDTVKEEVIDDVKLAVKTLSKRKEVNSKQIYVLGHSLGGYLIPRIASETKDVAGYILMAANARPIENLFVEQNHYLANLDDEINAEEQLQLDLVQKDYELSQNLDSLDESTKLFGGLTKAYLKDLKEYSPIDMAKKIEVPVLVTQGLRDYQVTSDDLKLWQEAFSTIKNWTFKTYEKANHLMMDGEGAPNPQEYLSSNTINKQLINDIAEFIVSSK